MHSFQCFSVSGRQGMQVKEVERTDTEYRDKDHLTVPHFPASLFQP